MAGQVKVTVQGLGGDELQYEMDVSDTVASLRTAVADAWSLDPKSFHLFSDSVPLADGADLRSCSDEEAVLFLQLVKFDPLPGLRKFEASVQRGIEVEIQEGNTEGHTSILRKTSNSPDSNNVFVSHPIREPCFVEFAVLQTLDELSIGVTSDRRRVEAVSGFQNLSLNCTWIYSKRKQMPTFLLAGNRLNPEGGREITRGIKQDDRVALFVDPTKQEVRFYKNGLFVASNLPDYPLPAQTDDPLWVYVMVDAVGDEVSIVRSGPETDFHCTYEIHESSREQSLQQS